MPSGSLSKFSGWMSWYFFGGFSAYAMLPSTRVVNHSGWAATQGWSGEHCRARSRATSRPSSRARATKASKSAKVPSSAWMASWPPCAEPVAYGEPGGRGCDGHGEAAERWGAVAGEWSGTWSQGRTYRGWVSGGTWEAVTRP